MQTGLKATRRQILAFRRRVGSLDERLPMSAQSLRRAAWAGLQDSMPRAALLSLHARVAGVESSTWEHSSLAQLWGPRYSTYVVPKRDFALFSLGRLPESGKGRDRAEAHGEAGARLPQRQADDRSRGRGRARRRQRDPIRGADRHARHSLGGRAGADRLVRPHSQDLAGRRTARARAALPPRLRADHGWQLRPVGRNLRAIRGRDLRVARRRAFAGSVAARRRVAARRGRAGDAIRRVGRRARAPAAERRCLFPARRSGARAARSAQGSAGAALDVARLARRAPLEGEIRGTWRRAGHTVRVETWARLSRGMRDAVEVEAATLPLPGLDRPIEVVWQT